MSDSISLKTKRKIAVITGTRAEYGLLYWTMRELQKHPHVTLQLIVTGAHLSHAHGYTVKQIEEDGFSIDARIDMHLGEDTALDITRSMGVCTEGVGKALANLAPDMVVILGDRYEMLAAASAALMLMIPIAHIHGGEVTQGAIDESIRHAITKMGYWHFATAAPYARRITQLGEDSTRVFVAGAPGIDNIARLPLLSRSDLADFIGLPLASPLLLCTFHPETLSALPVEAQIEEFIQALHHFPDATLIITGANADVGGKLINGMLQQFVEAHPNSVFHPSLGSLRYLSAMKHADVIVGNSSSGMIEAPALGRATVNIGDRQKGRIRTAAVIDCACDKDAITSSIEKALSPGFQKNVAASNVFGIPGQVGAFIADSLASLPIPERPNKPFYDLE